MKTLYLKSYSSAGTFLGNILQFQLDSFTKKINSGLEDMTITLPRTFDNYNVDFLVSLGNKIELWISDEDATMQKIYTGYIEQQKFLIDGSKQTIEIVCLGIVSKLTMDILKFSNQTTVYTRNTTGLTSSSGSLSDAELALIIKALIDYFRTNSGLNLSYITDTGDSVATSGKTMTYTFEAMTYSEALKKITEAAPQDWYWYIDENEVVYFKGPAATATHNFIIGKHITKLTIEKGIDSVKNIGLVWDGAALYNQYKDDLSISLYGRRVQQTNDQNIGVAGTIDNFANKFISENKDARVRVVVEIADNNESGDGYDIESIQPGDTCKITGIAASDILTDNMIIKEVNWTPGKATLTIETRSIFDINRFLVDLARKVEQQTSSGIPIAYTP